MEKALIEAYVKALLETDDEFLDEFSATGAIAGMTLPLGMSPEMVGQPELRRKKRRNKRKKK